MALHIYELLTHARRIPQLAVRREREFTANDARAMTVEALEEPLVGFPLLTIQTISKIRIFSDVIAICLALFALLFVSSLIPALFRGLVISATPGAFITAVYLSSYLIGKRVAGEELPKFTGLSRAFFLWRLLGLTPIAVTLTALALFLRM
jgi:hypothetical protein